MSQSPSPRGLPRDCRGRGGFTLLELLIVIVVISILLSLIFPMVTMLRNSAKKATARRMVMELSLAMESYRSEDARHLFPTPSVRPPTSGEYIKRDPAAADSVLMLLEKVGGYAVPTQHVDRDSASPTYLALLDPWKRPYFYKLDGAYLSSGTLDAALMDGNVDKPTGSGPVATPPAPLDWNSPGTEPFAYLWSIGIPRTNLAADSAPTNSSRWVYPKSSD